MNLTFDHLPWAPRSKISSALSIINFKLLQQEYENKTPFTAGTERYRLQQALFNVGFFYLEHHGIDESKLYHQYDIMRSFYALPLHEKNKYHLDNTFLGYKNFAEESLAKAAGVGDYPDLCEKYTWDFGTKNIAPSAEFSAAWTDYMACQTQLASQLLTIICSLLNLTADEKNLFDEAAQGQGMLRHLRYPNLPRKNDSALAMAPHRDIGLLTLSFQVPSSNRFVALEVELDKEFISIPALRNTFVVNVGEVLGYLSQHKIKSPIHRVIYPPEALSDDNHERTAIVFFFDPNPNIKLHSAKVSHWKTGYSNNDINPFEQFKQNVAKNLQAKD